MADDQRAKTVGDALHIRNAVLRRVAQIELESDPALRRRLGHFVVIGGGFSGVEVAGLLVDYLRGVRRYYARVRKDELCVTLLQDQRRLLLELPGALALAAHRSLTERGVRVRLGARALEVTDAEVRLACGDTLAAATVICTIGTRPSALAEALDLQTERRRILVNGDLGAKGATGIWALGDCAHFINAHDGLVSPPTAQFAVRQARCLAANLLATLSADPTKTFGYRSYGAMAAIGRLTGVAQIRGFSFTGLPAWLLWRAYYLSQMPTLSRKLRVFVE